MIFKRSGSISSAINSQLLDVEILKISTLEVSITYPVHPDLLNCEDRFMAIIRYDTSVKDYRQQLIRTFTYQRLKDGSRARGMSYEKSFQYVIYSIATIDLDTEYRSRNEVMDVSFTTVHRWFQEYSVASEKY